MTPLGEFVDDQSGSGQNAGQQRMLNVTV